MKHHLMIVLFIFQVIFLEAIFFTDLNLSQNQFGDIILYYRKINSYDAPDYGYRYTHYYQYNVTTGQDSLILNSSYSYHFPTDFLWWSESTIYDLIFDFNGNFVACGRAASGDSENGTTSESIFFKNNYGIITQWDIPGRLLNLKKASNDLHFLLATYYEFPETYKLIQSTDFGENWSTFDEAPNYLLKGISPESGIYGASSDGKLFKSESLDDPFLEVDFTPQLNWESSNVDHHLYSSSLTFLFDIDGEHIFAIVKDSSNGQFHLVRSNDNGLNWDIISSEGVPIFIDLDNLNSGIIFKSVDSTIYKSNNYGDTFEFFQNLPNSINGIAQVDDSDTLYVITYNALYNVTVNSINILIQNTSIEDEEVITSYSNTLKNYPNPFNPETTILFSIPNDSKVDISIYNVKGQKVKTLTNSNYNTGEHSIIWKGDDDSGNNVSSGLYLYKFMVNDKTEAVKKCLLLK
ncbi:MAG: T9SS type A sorting domain-containing protein [Candidatus Cloacimonetes bacterium]|nr:T9SS type A sorting domain-containing protein [Candidatus Cloacimonadota bacterium]